MEINKLVEKGGKRWQKGNYERVYFNPEQVMEHAGFIVTKDITGTKIRNAQIRGKELPKYVGDFLEHAFNNTKLYYDVNIGKWEYKIPDCGVTVERELVQSINDFVAWVNE